jgi:hypothetical protein
LKVIAALLAMLPLMLEAQVPSEITEPTPDPPALIATEVEVLVFARDSSAANITALNAQPTYSGRALTPTSATDEPAQALETAPSYVERRGTRLAAAANRLRGQAGLRVVAHRTWKQPLNGVAIEIRDAQEQLIGTVLSTSIAEGTGTVQVDFSVGTGDEWFRLRQRQQNRLGTAVYFDHARLGAIILVSPIVPTPPPSTPAS